MADANPRVRSTLEGGCITLLSLYVALLVTGQLQRVRDDVWLVGGLVGIGLCYVYARNQTD